jgi:hypothetical protein
VTLLEVMVAAVVVSLALGILLRLSGAAYRIGHAELERGAAEARLLLASRKLEADLLSSSARGVSLSADGKRAAIQPLGGVLPSGQVTFEPVFMLWCWSAESGRLIRLPVVERPDKVPFDGAPFRWSLPQLRDFPVQGGELGSFSTEGITEFFLTSPAVPPPELGATLELSLRTELKLAATRRAVQLRKVIQLRTSGV